MQQRMFLSVSLCFVFAIVSAQPKTCYTPEDKQIFDRYLSYIEPFCDTSDDTVLEKTATFFLNTPYVAHTLEARDEETLVVNLREFDCVTFVEMVIALAGTATSENRSFDTYLEKLQQIRYRNGVVHDYSSRLHYTSDWVFENEKNGLLKNISATLGGIREEKTIDFMSTHRAEYKRFSADDAMLAKIVAMEKTLNRRNGFFYLPKMRISAAAPDIPHMGMIAFTTAIKGLDTTHVGFAFKKNGTLTFIHASSTEKKVIIDEKSLAEYCAGQKACTGVMVMKGIL